MRIIRLHALLLVVLGIACGDENPLVFPPGDTAGDVATDASDDAADDAADDPADDAGGDPPNDTGDDTGEDAAEDPPDDADTPDDASDVPSDAADAADAPDVPVRPEIPMRNPFTVRVASPTSLVEAGGSVTFAAEIFYGEPEGTVEWVWDADGGTMDSPEDPAGRTVTFADPGEYAVAATATDESGSSATSGGWVRVVAAGATFRIGDVDDDGTVSAADVEATDAFISGGGEFGVDEIDRMDVDLDGRVTEADSALIDGAVLAGADAPRHLSTTSGAPTKRVWMIHPALLDPSAEVTWAFGTADAITPFRAAPGYATGWVPVDFEEPAEVDFVLLVDGEEADRFAFEVLALPEASADPAATVVGALEDVGAAAHAVAGAIQIYLDGFEFESDQAAALEGMAVWAADAMDGVVVDFEAAFGEMTELEQERYEQVMLANGLEEALNKLRALTGALEELEDGIEEKISITGAAAVIDVICVAKDIADIADKVSEINEMASEVLSYLDWFPLNVAPGVGQVVRFLSSLSDLVGTITDIIGLVAEYIPDFGDDLDITAADPDLEIGDSTAIRVTVELKIVSGLCGRAASALIGNLGDQVTGQLQKAIGKQTPFFSGAFRRGRYNAENMGWVAAEVYGAIGDIAGGIVEALGLEEALEGLAGAICGLIDDPDLPLDPSIIAATCGSAISGSWTCTASCVGAIRLNARTDVCDEEKRGEAFIQCRGCRPEICEGCCSDPETCVADEDQSIIACGSGGLMCEACESHEVCDSGTCVCESNCDEEGLTQCAGDTVQRCDLVADDCLQWRDNSDCTLTGSTCEDGECVGGCTIRTCAGGCCNYLHECVLFADQSTFQCGRDARACFTCTGAPDIDSCVSGRCSCTDFCEPTDPPTCVEGEVQACTGESESGCARLETAGCTGGLVCIDGEGCIEDDNPCGWPLVLTPPDEGGWRQATLLFDGEVLPCPFSYIHGMAFGDAHAVLTTQSNTGGPVSASSLGAHGENGWSIVWSSLDGAYPEPIAMLPIPDRTPVEVDVVQESTGLVIHVVALVDGVELTIVDAFPVFDI